MRKDYKKQLYRYVKEHHRNGHSLESIEKALVAYGLEADYAKKLILQHKINNAIAIALPIIAVLAVFISMPFLIKPSIVGYSTTAKSFNFSDDVGIAASESSEYLWNTENKGALRSVRLNGRVKVSGSAKAYLEGENFTYLIFDSDKLKSGLEKITAFAVRENKTKGPDDEKTKNKTKQEDNDIEFGDDEGVENETSADDTINVTEPITQNITTDLNETLDTTTTANETINETEIEAPEINETILNGTINATPVSNETVLNETMLNITLNKTIKLSLQYRENSNYDEDNDGIESINGVVDLTVENTEFSWEANEERLCTRWEVYNVNDSISTTFCNGNAGCCAFIGLLPSSGNWNNAYYSTFGKDGTGLNNIVSAQIIYYDANLSIDNPKSEIYYSEWQNLSVNFHEEYMEFRDICIQTCILPDLNSTSYKIRLEVNNSELIADSISYEILGNETANHAPVLLGNISDISFYRGQSYAINLSSYFYDEDNDTLGFGPYNNSEIYVSMVNESAILTSPEFTGTSFMYFIANDSAYTAVSNVFKIEVKERKGFGPGLKSLRKIIGIT
ncbi:hypothetical protein HYT53_05915 [Candidatus Woesearchaeota archaeon]|nr:hypothetical protein [Candidatus Woesearchaeota archaeon]